MRQDGVLGTAREDDFQRRGVLSPRAMVVDAEVADRFQQPIGERVLRLVAIERLLNLDEGIL